MEKQTKEIKNKISVLFWSFVIFSILGMIVEMVYCYVTTGIIESRQGLVWGPFCPIYGVGAVIAIIVLDRVKESSVKLFVCGALLGGVVEYILSYILEAMYGTRFWDYSYTTYNLNGRICFLYSVFWGVLAILVIRIINPMFTKVIEKFHSNRIKKVIEKLLFIFLIIDSICTVWAVNSYESRVKNIYYKKDYKKTLGEDIAEKIFSNEYMLKAFPNIRFITDTGEEIFIRNVITNK